MREMHAFNPRTQEAEASESEFKASLVDRVSGFQSSKGYIEKLCLRKKINNNLKTATSKRAQLIRALVTKPGH